MVAAVSSSAASVARPTRGLSRLLIAAAAAGFLLLVAIIGALAGQPAATSSYQPSANAVADIPADYLADYERAAQTYGLDWAVLAAIGKIECDHGRSRAAGCFPPGTVNAAGATGPMQFLGSTWRAGTPAMTVPPVGAPARAGE